MNKLILLPMVFLAACSAETTLKSEAISDPVILAPAPEPTPMIEVETEPLIENVHEPALVASLMGLSPSEVINRMGKPNLVRRDGLGQIMLFERETCVFDVVFYADNIEAPYLAEHISARTLSGQKRDSQQCLSEIKPGGFDNYISN